jgi:hypothetical protein
LDQLNLIDLKNKTLKEFNTHFDPKVYFKKGPSIKTINDRKKKRSSSEKKNEEPLGGKQEEYKFKNHLIEKKTIQKQRQLLVYQLKKKNYSAL